VILLGLKSASQELVKSLNLNLDKSTEAFQIIDEETNDINLFLNNKKTITSLRLNEKMIILDSLSADKPDKNAQVLGTVVFEGKPTVYWSISNQKKIISQTFDIQNSKTTSATFDLAFKNEVYLKAISVKNRFVVLSLLKDKNALKLYLLNTNGNLETKEINLDGLRLYHRSTLLDTFEEAFDPLESSYSLELIDSKSPISLSQSAKKRKCYVNNNQINISIDTDVTYTHLFTIDLEKYSIVGKTYQNTPNKFFNSSELNSNSFLKDDKLYQIKTSSSKAIFTIKNLDDAVLKEYEISNDKPITFKNSEVIQENGSINNKRTLTETSQFTRKINNLNVGISLYETNNQYYTTLGSVSEVKESNGVIYGAMFGAVGTLLYYAVSNPVLENFNSYANRKVVYFDSLFDQNGNHIQGALKPLAFEKIRKFLSDKKDLTSHTVFKLDTSYYLGYFDVKSKQYSILKFTE
jgi:hypothetical protein